MKHIDCGPRRGVSARSESAIIRAPRRVAAIVACALCAAALVNPCDAKSRNIQKNQVVTIAVDAAADRVPINPLIYGMVLAQPHDVSVLNVPLNVWSGNTTTDYNWSLDATNTDSGNFFMSQPKGSLIPGGAADKFVSGNLQAGAQSTLLIPLAGYVANLGLLRNNLWSFSIAKYGPQCASSPGQSDAGDGLEPDCKTFITGNNPNDAYVADSVLNEKGWLEHLVGTWGSAANGGVGYYMMDQEASIWFQVHRDIHPVGAHATEYLDKVLAESQSLKSVDPSAKVVAPEEWGWNGYLCSGYDQQTSQHHCTQGYDHTQVQGGLDYIPWLLSQWQAAGHPVDVVSVHFFPPLVYNNDTSQATELLRNQSTRLLWDPNYVEPGSWIKTPIDLIPRLQAWVSQYYYAGTPVALTSYDWGGEGSMNGATAQADILGIFGREQLGMGARWLSPAENTPTYSAVQMYRNYDGAGSTFGDTSVSAQVPQPDNLSAFAALRTSDGALTLMVISKVLSGSTPVSVTLANSAASGSATVYRLAASAPTHIQQMPNVAWSSGVLSDNEPAQSITLYVLPQNGPR
jgi:hypothetical protein